MNQAICNNLESFVLDKGDFWEISCSAPSNIALVKYWGKDNARGPQIPSNPSLSFSLENCRTFAFFKVSKEEVKSPSFSFFFEGKASPTFEKKMRTWLTRLEEESECARNIWAFLSQRQVELHSMNTFPHSAGIASSASSYAAFAFCFWILGQRLLGKDSGAISWQEISTWARLGSGSACRSLFAGFTSWGQSNLIAHSSDYYANSLENVHSTFKDIRDCILIVDSQNKAVSSTQGHATMEKHPFKDERQQIVRQHFQMVLNALASGDWALLGQTIEQEALHMHAMMLSANPAYLLMKAASFNVINKIRAYRDSTKLPLYFTLDAGPNIHLLFPAEVEVQVMEFVREHLQSDLENGKWILDQVAAQSIKQESYFLE